MLLRWLIAAGAPAAPAAPAADTNVPNARPSINLWRPLLRLQRLRERSARSFRRLIVHLSPNLEPSHAMQTDRYCRCAPIYCLSI